MKEESKPWINFYDYQAMMRFRKFKNKQLLKYMPYLIHGTEEQKKEVQKLIEEENNHYNEIYGGKEDQRGDNL